MILKAIKNETDYDRMLAWVDAMFDKNLSATSAEGEQLHIALLLIKEYEDQYYPIPSPDPIEVLKLKMEERGMKAKELTELLGGSKSYISQILSRKKPLTLNIARILHQKLGISADALLA